MQCSIATLAPVQLVSGCGQVLALAVVEVQPRPLARRLFKRSKVVLTKWHFLISCWRGAF